MKAYDSADVDVQQPAVTLTGGNPSPGKSPAGPGVPAFRRSVDRRNLRNTVPNVTGLLSMLIGLSDIISVIVPDWQERLRRMHATVVPGTLVAVTGTAVVITGLLLLMLSHGLRRRKRRAWQAAVVLLAFNIVVHLLHGLSHLALALVSLVALGALLYFSDQFYASGDPRTRWRGWVVFCGLAVADVAICLAYILLARGLASNYSFFQRLQHVLYGLVGFSGPVQFVPESRGDLFNLLTTGLGLFTLIVTGYLFLRPAKPQGRLGQQDAARIRDSLGYFALRNDKNVVWSPTGKSCICYRVVSGVMLASGDPLGDPEAWPGAINAFLDEAAVHAWVPAVMGCSELGAEIWCREGCMTALELGDEAIVDVADFSLSGRQMRNVRQMVSRVARQGYVAQIRRLADIPRTEIDGIIRQADSWRGSPTERGFSMALGRVGGPGDDDCVVATATENGVLRALLHFVPWGSDGLSLDLMRRDRTSQPGLNDFLIVEAIKVAPDLGVKRLSLNFTVFRAALASGEKIGAGPVLRAWRSLLVFASRWFQIESLYKFNAKFCPVWEPRFFVYPGTRDTPRIAMAALEAEAFLVWPKLEVKRHARRLARALGLGRLRARAAERRRSPSALRGAG